MSFDLSFPPSSLRRSIWRLTLACVCLPVTLSVQANPFETTLDNGMKIVVREDRRAPSVVHMIWYRSGAMDEPAGVTGVAHVLEHMMFKGTRKVGPGEFNMRISALGGRDNAFTSNDYTAYFQQTPPAHLGTMMSLEADRMKNLTLTDEDFSREIEVIKEERRLRTDDRPRALVHEQLMATIFQVHPYHHPIIGWMADLVTMTAEDTREWYRNWYAPNNATLVVVGDVDHQAVFKLARQHYGTIKSTELPIRRISIEPGQTGPRSVVVRAPAELPYLAMAWRVPSLRKPDTDRESYALQMLAEILDGYDGARLNRRLVREQRIAVSAGAAYDGINRGPALFLLEGAPAPGQSLETLETALRAELQRIRDEGVSEDELNRVKNQALATRIYSRDSLMGQAMEIGQLESAGLSWRDEVRLLAGLRAVTAEEVRSVARRYFDDASLTNARLDPLPLPTSPAPESSSALQRP
ncbi:MAG: insulinase family protein [Betaproteobacteria bacterium]|nr:insulinase family protein [Betaproteobacteria bacterium]